MFYRFIPLSAFRALVLSFSRISVSPMRAAFMPLDCKRAMSLCVVIPDSETKILSCGTSFFSLTLVCKSTLKSRKSRLFTPISRAFVLSAFCRADSLCDSTSTLSPKECAMSQNSRIFSHSKISLISSTQSAPSTFA